MKITQLPRKGLLADFGQIGLDQLVEFKTSDFYDLIMFKMQLEEMQRRAKELDAQLVIYHMSGNKMAENYLMKFSNT